MAREKTFETGCYHFGEGGAVNISISAELLAYYVQQGFSRRSLCMALISAIRFDPETGRRLATYVVIYDLKELRRHPDDMGDTISRTAAGDPFLLCSRAALFGLHLELRCLHRQEIERHSYAEVQGLRSASSRRRSAPSKMDRTRPPGIFAKRVTVV